jgi:hypothetical protein
VGKFLPVSQRRLMRSKQWESATFSGLDSTIPNRLKSVYLPQYFPVFSTNLLQPNAAKNAEPIAASQQ